MMAIELCHVVLKQLGFDYRKTRAILDALVKEDLIKMSLCSKTQQHCKLTSKGNKWTPKLHVEIPNAENESVFQCKHQWWRN